MGQVIATLNEKGGTGKTVLAVNLAVGLLAAGKTVLVIDEDKMNGASDWLGAKESPGLADCLAKRIPLSQMIQVTPAGVDVVSSGGTKLDGQKKIIAAETGSHLALSRIFDPVLERYDFIIIDTKGGWDDLTLATGWVANAFILPVIPEAAAIKGTISIIRDMNAHLKALGAIAYPANLGFVVSNAAKKAAHRVGLETLQRLESNHGVSIFAEIIKSSNIASNAQMAKEPVFLHSPKSQLAKSFAAIAAEVVAKMKKVGDSPWQAIARLQPADADVMGLEIDEIY